MSRTAPGRQGFDLSTAILVFLLVTGLGLLALGGRQVALHLQSLSWQPVTATLRDLGGELAFRGSGPVPFEAGSRLIGRYTYDWNGQVYEGARLSVSLGYTRRRSTADDWQERLSRHLGAPGDRITVWVNPRYPAQAVAFRDLRWLELGSEVSFGLFLTMIGMGIWQGRTATEPVDFSWRAVARTWVVGCLLGVLAPLLWLDGHPIWASITMLPLVVAVYGTIYGLRRRQAAGAENRP
jgi:hypothetical protein